MSATPARHGLLFVSNGHGEDSIAAAVVRGLPSGGIEAFPVIGSGSAYEGVCPIVGPRATVSSEGWRNVKGSLRRDIAGGGLATIPPAVSFIRSSRPRYERTVVVGDMVGVYLCLAAGVRGVIYLDVYKTGFGKTYSALDRLALRRVAKTVFCRHESLAAALRAGGIDARCAGNLMMDTIPYGDYDANSRRRRGRAITLLPGSRALTAESFALQVQALRRLSGNALPDVFAAIAGSIDVDDLAAVAGMQRTGPLTMEAGDLGAIADARLTIHLARGGVMGNLIEASDLVLSQAGTATVQALGLGRPAITFQHQRDRPSRFRAETALFGEARLVVPADAGAGADALGRLLADDAERARRGAIGRERIGPPGAMEAIVAEIGR